MSLPFIEAEASTLLKQELTNEFDKLDLWGQKIIITATLNGRPIDAFFFTCTIKDGGQPGIDIFFGAADQRFVAKYVAIKGRDTISLGTDRIYIKNAEEEIEITY